MLGALFRYTSVKKVKTNLMVFLRPTILRTKEDSFKLTRSKYNFIRSEQLRLGEDGVSLMSNESHPVMPEAEEFLELPAPFITRSQQQKSSENQQQDQRAPAKRDSVSIFSDWEDEEGEF